MDRFEENNVQFLHITIDKIDNDLYYKLTHTRKYSDVNFSLPWNYKNLQLKSLYHRARKKYFRPQRNLNLKLIILNCLCHETAINYTIVILLLSDLQTTLKEKQIMTKIMKRKLSGLHLPYFGHIGDKIKKR